MRRETDAMKAVNAKETPGVRGAKRGADTKALKIAKTTRKNGEAKYPYEEHAIALF